MEPISIGPVNDLFKMFDVDSKGEIIATELIRCFNSYSSLKDVRAKFTTCQAAHKKMAGINEYFVSVKLDETYLTKVVPVVKKKKGPRPGVKRGSYGRR